MCVPLIILQCCKSARSFECTFVLLTINCSDCTDVAPAVSLRGFQVVGSCTMDNRRYPLWAFMMGYFNQQGWKNHAYSDAGMAEQ